MPLEPHTRRFQEIRRAEVRDHFFIITIARTEKGVAKTARRFDNGGVGGETLLSEQRGFGAVARGLVGGKRLYQPAFLTVDAPGGPTRDDPGALHALPDR